MTDELKYAIDTAREAGKVVLSYYGQTERLTKREEEAVTEADRAAQRAIVSSLRKRFPTDGIIGEESESGYEITFECPDPMGRVWIIDPIDGTNNFIAGLGNFGVCIALFEGGQPVLGVVLDVTRDEVYSAARGQGAWLGNRPLKVLDTPLSARTILMMTGNVLDAKGRAPGWACKWLSQSQWKPRILGSAALETVAVAAGVAHAAVTVNGKLWDVAAPAAIVLEAGGLMTDLAGRPLFPFDLRGYTGAKVPFLAAAPLAQSELLKQLREHP
jgi:myo-inositol-1(or 4)-monophosphatase